MDLMDKAIATTQSKTPEATVSDTSDEMTMDDGTVTVPTDLIKGEPKEGDIIQFEVLTQTDAGLVLRPVESRVKNDGVGKENTKASENDNSSITAEKAVSNAIDTVGQRG